MNAKTIATLLYEMTAGKSDAQMRVITGRLIDYLLLKRQTSLVPAIVSEYERIERQKIQVRVAVASSAEKKRCTKEIGAILASMGTDSKHAVATVNSTLVSGFIVEGKGRRFDHSGKTRLVALYRTLIS